MICRGRLVPKLPLGNPVSKAPALRAGKLELPVLNSQAGAWELARRRGSFFLNLMAVTQRVGTIGNDSFRLSETIEILNP